MVNMKFAIRRADHPDAAAMQAGFMQMGWAKPEGYFANCCRLQDEGKLVLLYAEVNGSYAGHCKVVWEPTYPFFKAHQIPETQNLNVLGKHRRLGMVTRLMDEAERLISQRAAIAGIGVGLYRDTARPSKCTSGAAMCPTDRA